MVCVIFTYQTKERNKDDKKFKFSRAVFSNFIKVSRSCTVDLAIDQARDVIHKHFAIVCFVFPGAAPIPYVQAAILNLMYAVMYRNGTGSKVNRLPLPKP